jgi:outer membrane protein assembly factor BamB
MIPVYSATRKKGFRDCRRKGLSLFLPRCYIIPPGNMIRLRLLCITFVATLALAAFAGQAKKPLVDPFPLRFPLVEAGTLEIEGHVVGQPRAYDGIVYFATREGYLSAVVVSARSVLWRFKADHPVSSSPEIAGETVLVLDDGGVLYHVDRRLGSAASQSQLAEVVTTSFRYVEGGLLCGTAEGKVKVLALGGWEYRPAGPNAKVTAGPVPVYGDDWADSILFGRSDGLLVAVDLKGRPVWEFKAGGAIQADPAVAGGRVYFGDSDRMFYCLGAATGKLIWRRRLQGAPLHQALMRSGTLAVPASNSVVYFLSRKGGSILSWETVPSRVIYPLSPAGRFILVSSADPSITALDHATGKRVGQHIAPAPLVAGALWVPPFVIAFVEDQASGRQRIVFLRSR